MFMYISLVNPVDYPGKISLLLLMLTYTVVYGAQRQIPKMKLTMKLKLGKDQLHQ